MRTNFLRMFVLLFACIALIAAGSTSVFAAGGALGLNGKAQGVPRAPAGVAKPAKAVKPKPVKAAKPAKPAKAPKPAPAPVP